MAATRHQVSILAAGNAGIHAGAASLQPVRIDPGILDRLPSRLEQHSLLRIEQPRIQRRDPEELGIELIDPFHESGLSISAVLSWQILDEFLPQFGFPPFVRHRVRSRRELIPECGQIRRARETASHAHDRDPGFTAASAAPRLRRLDLFRRRRWRRRTAAVVEVPG